MNITTTNSTNTKKVDTFTTDTLVEKYDFANDEATGHKLISSWEIAQIKNGKFDLVEEKIARAIFDLAKKLRSKMVTYNFTIRSTGEILIGGDMGDIQHNKNLKKGYEEYQRVGSADTIEIEL